METAKSQTPDQAPPSVPADLRGDSLLWMINRVVFHPRGFALGIAIGENEEELSLVLFGDGSEPWSYDREAIDEDAHFDRVEALLQRARESNRS